MLAGDDPAVTMAAINAAMVKKGLDAEFVTLFYGILSPDGELTYCNPGHNPPLLVGKNGVRRLKTGGLLVGLFEDAEYKFEVVPTDGLEKTLWAEADKLGFFINTLTESVVAKETQVVKNEKRQGVDNRPYGHTDYVLDRALYPDGHPDRSQVIGSPRCEASTSLTSLTKAFPTARVMPMCSTCQDVPPLEMSSSRRRRRTAWYTLARAAAAVHPSAAPTSR